VLDPLRDLRQSGGGEDEDENRSTHGSSSYPIRDRLVRNLKSKTKSEQESAAADRDLYSGLIRLHVLHHAVEGPVFGLGMMEELARHGYRISPGSLYPLLAGLEKKGYLRSKEERNGKSLRRVYRATPLGKRALKASKVKVRELFHELMEDE
jgi:DNA-binding PadR family transcriptional regulator